MNRRNLIAIVLTSFIMISLLVLAVPIRSSPESLGYDPWIDLNDDGKIDILESIIIGNHFLDSGEPINKTVLLYNVNDTFTGLLSRIDGLNTSLATMVTSIVTMNTTITQLNDRVSALEGSYGSLLSRLNALEANYSVTNMKLAPYAIPFAVAYNNTYDTTHEQFPNWVDLGGMSVTLNLSRSSQVLIIWTGELQNLGDGGVDPREDSQVYVRALVNNTAIPPYGYAQPSIDPTGAFGLVTHSHYILWGGYTFTYCSSPLTAGFYEIKIQWTCHLGKGEVMQRQLTVIALPA